MNFNNLFNTTIEEGNTGKVANSIDRIPTNSDLRLFWDGKIYPSKKLVEDHNLQYKNKDYNFKELNGFDLVRTDKWGAYKGEDHFILISEVPKKLNKVDLFGSCKFDKEGNPLIDVMNGSSRGHILLDMLKEVHNIEVKEGDYIDLNIVTKHGALMSPNDVYNIPKLVTKGNKAGQWSYVTRNNLNLYPLEIVKHNMTENTNNENEEIRDEEIETSNLFN